jgi:hypothetical protein
MNVVSADPVMDSRQPDGNRNMPDVMPRLVRLPDVGPMLIPVAEPGRPSRLSVACRVTNLFGQYS